MSLGLVLSLAARDLLSAALSHIFSLLTGVTPPRAEMLGITAALQIQSNSQYWRLILIHLTWADVLAVLGSAQLCALGNISLYHYEVISWLFYCSVSLFLSLSSPFLWTMTLLFANFPSYAAANDLQLICIDGNYELLSCSGLTYFSFIIQHVRYDAFMLLI